MRRIISALFVISVTSIVAFGLTNAFFSDTETSSGNIFQSGKVDLKIDNDEVSVDIVEFTNSEVVEEEVIDYIPEVQSTFSDTVYGENIIGMNPFNVAEGSVNDGILNDPTYLLNIRPKNIIDSVTVYLTSAPSFIVAPGTNVGLLNIQGVLNGGQLIVIPI